MNRSEDREAHGILLVHLGGLGDVCLSESTFHSIRVDSTETIEAVGYKRFLGLFDSYFDQVDSVEERRWLWLFSDVPCERAWQHTVLIGKDRHGDMRRRLSGASQSPPLCIELYPENEATHVEAYQLAQLAAAGVQPLKKEPVPSREGSGRIILYPEQSYTKKKWPYEHFIEVYARLKEKGVDALLLEAPEHEPSCEDSLQFDDLEETARLFREGGLFFSNDSGVAHLAGACGMATITLFWDHDPAVWHPRGRNLSILCTAHPPGTQEMVTLIERTVI